MYFKVSYTVFFSVTFTTAPNNLKLKIRLERIAIFSAFRVNHFTTFSLFVPYFALPWTQKSKMADPKWPPFDNHDVITTSYYVITSRYGSQRNIDLWKYYLSSKPHCHSVYSCEVMRARRPVRKGQNIK